MGEARSGWIPRRQSRGLGQTLIPYDQLTPAQWYELIALTTNQPLAQVQSLYSQIPAGQTGTPASPLYPQTAPVTNLQVTVGAHTIAQSAYSAYQQGNIVYAPQGGHYFQYGGAWYDTCKQIGCGDKNPWAIPTQAPTPAQVVAATTAMFNQYRLESAAPIYSQNQNQAAVIAAYNAANPQAPVVVNPSPGSQSTSSGTATSASGSTVSQANGQTTTSGSTVNQGTFDLANLFGSTEWIPGVPNVAVVIGAVAAVGLLVAAGAKGR